MALTHWTEVWEGFVDGTYFLQRPCDGDGCDRGMLYNPARFCTKCLGTGKLAKLVKEVT